MNVKFRFLIERIPIREALIGYPINIIRIRLENVHNWREFAIGECSELERCQIAGNPTVF